MADSDDGFKSADETFVLNFKSAELDEDSADAPYLIVFSGPRVGEMVKLKERLIIGRGQSTDLRVQDEGVSRNHAEIVATEDGACKIRDLGSRNGTFVNGKRVEDPTQLKDGDKIVIGSITIFKFFYADKQEKNFQEQMYNSALRDPLTGLYNRRFLLNHLEAEFSYAVRHQISLSLVMMDIDHFKSINDTYGHQAGDQVLVGLSGLLKGAIRTEDLAARYGGEEFVVVCRGIPAQVATKVTNRVRLAIEMASFIPEDTDRTVTISAGVASVPDARIPDPETLIDSADKALYEAKRAGRNRVMVF